MGPLFHYRILEQLNTWEALYNFDAKMKKMGGKFVMRFSCSGGQSFQSGNVLKGQCMC
jgi:hypothetical protein